MLLCWMQPRDGNWMSESWVIVLGLSTAWFCNVAWNTQPEKFIKWGVQWQQMGHYHTSAAVELSHQYGRPQNLSAHEWTWLLLIITSQLQNVLKLYYSLRFQLSNLSRRRTPWSLDLQLLGLQPAETKQNKHSAGRVLTPLDYIMDGCVYCSKISAALLRQPRELTLYGECEVGYLGSWEEYTQHNSCPNCRLIVRCLQDSNGTVGQRQFRPNCRICITLTIFGFWITNVCCLP
jgi:hypothetical protein